MANFTKKERLLIGYFAQGEARRIKHSNPVSPAYAEMRQNRLPVCESIMEKLRNGDSPITAEWLGEMGAKKVQLTMSAAYHIYTPDNILIATEFVDGVASVVTDRKFTHTPERWANVKTRREFEWLYRLLSGKELGGE